MKKSLFIFGLLLSLASLAQEKETPKNLADSLRIGYWTRGTQFGINFNQASFNDSWQGGGVNNTALGFIFGHKADLTKGKGVWSNDLQLQYGFLNNKGQGTRKSIDRIFFDTKYAQKISAKLNWFANVNFLSQFGQGVNYDKAGQPRISNFMAPGYLSEGVGIEYKPNKYMAWQLGGAMLRQTFVQDDKVFANTKNADGASYGVEKGNKMLNEMGFNVVGNFNKDVAKNINLKWRYSGFLAYAPKSKPLDHRLDLTTTAKINKYLNVNFTVIGIYDTDIIKDWQLSEGFAVGFLYTL